MRSSYVYRLTTGGITAALYVLLTILSSAFGLSSGPVQIRLSEMLTILPCFFSAAVPGLLTGCVLANLLTGAVLWDVVFGGLITFLAAVFTRVLRKHRFLAPLPPIFLNAVFLPLILQKCYGIPESYALLFLLILAGELVSAGLLGQGCYEIMKKLRLPLENRQGNG